MKKKILIAEDEPGLRMLYADELEEDGYEVITAKDGKDAIERYQEGGLDLIILDIAMPVMDGIDALRHLKDKNGKVPVILHSSHPDYLVDPIAGLADAYIMKSSDLKGLKEKVRDILKEPI
jgi:two-component system response regulator (stage 0 sporulation protein F)